MINIRSLIVLSLFLFLAGCGTYSSFTVKSAPSGADILVDGKVMGKTPATIKVPFPENNQLVREKKIVSVKLKGYKEVKEILCYEGDTCKLLNFELVAEPVSDVAAQVTAPHAELEKKAALEAGIK